MAFTRSSLVFAFGRLRRRVRSAWPGWEKKAASQMSKWRASDVHSPSFQAASEVAGLATGLLNCWLRSQFNCVSSFVSQYAYWACLCESLLGCITSERELKRNSIVRESGVSMGPGQGSPQADDEYQSISRVKHNSQSTSQDHSCNTR